MANSWLRLWHDMPNDPKWRTIARVSKQPIALVIATYIHILVSASQNVTRGHIDVTTEDIASALDCELLQIDSIIEAMQGRVIHQGVLSGWDSRQVKREDSGNDETGSKSAAERKREQREREKLERDNELNEVSHAVSRNVTTDKDKDKDKEEEKNLKSFEAFASSASKKESSSSESSFEKFWSAYPKKKNKGQAEKAWIKLRPTDELVSEIMLAVSNAKSSSDWAEDSGKFIPYPATWISKKGWCDSFQVEVANCYSQASIGLMNEYNDILAVLGWPEASLDPYMSEREENIKQFLTFGTKPDWVSLYLVWMGESLEAKSGYGFDWLIKKETFLRAREGNFSKIKVAA